MTYVPWTDEQKAEFGRKIDAQRKRVNQRIESLSKDPFTDEEIQSIESILNMGAEEGACMYGDTTEEDTQVLIGRIMNILESVNK